MSETGKHEHGPQCSHAHHHDGQLVDAEPLDPANAALAEALRISFVVLKVVMIGVLVLFVYSGMFEVKENEEALILRFGKIQGSGSQAILESGWHWAWPAPIDEVVKVPSSKTERQLNVNSFWYYQTEKEKVLGGGGKKSGPLMIGKDGYTLTASRSRLGQEGVDDRNMSGSDYNLIHTRWAIRYRVENPELFIETVWDGTDAGWASVNDLLRFVLDDAVVLTSANRDIDWMIWENPKAFREQVENRMKKRLMKLDVGIVASLNLVEKSIPTQVKDSFDAVAQAKIEAQKLSKDAEAKANEIVNKSKADSDIQIAEAKAYKSRIVQEASADEKYLRSILAQINETVVAKVSGTSDADKAARQVVFDELLAVTVDTLYQETLRAVIGSADEVFDMPSAKDKLVEMRLFMSRDATLGPAAKKSDDNGK